jgi:hypothetical protein
MFGWGQSAAIAIACRAKVPFTSRWSNSVEDGTLV